MTANIEKIRTGIDKGKISKLSNILPRNPIVNTTITDPKRLSVGVPSKSVIKRASITSTGKENIKPINIDIKQIYGMSETTGIISLPDKTFLITKSP